MDQQLFDTPPEEDKYIVFKRDEFKKQHIGELTERYYDIELKDAVVIRRQDYFASPALASYAASIAIAARMMEDNDPSGYRKRLLHIADYFEQQAQLAAEEGWKLPD